MRFLERSNLSRLWQYDSEDISKGKGVCMISNFKEINSGTTLSRDMITSYALWL